MLRAFCLVECGCPSVERGASSTPEFLDLLDIFFRSGVVSFDVIVGQGQVAQEWSKGSQHAARTMKTKRLIQEELSPEFASHPCNVHGFRSTKNTSHHEVLSLQCR